MQTAETLRLDSVLRAAQLYHLDGLTQAAVADRLGCTRWTVGRLLAEAQDLGLLRIEIHHPEARRVDLERRLVEEFGLSEARVVPSQHSTVASTALVLTQTADYLRDLRPRPRVAAFGWGRTLAGVARAMPDSWAADTVVVQGCGAPNQVSQVLGEDIVRTLAEKSSGRGITMDAPTIASSAAAAKQFKSRPDIEAALQLAARADVCVYAPGTTKDCSLLVKCGDVTEAELDAASDMGGTVNVLGRFVNDAGVEVSQDLKDRTVGLTLDQIRAIRTLVAVGAGEAKAGAMASAMTARLARVVVTDSLCAEAILSGH